MLATLGTMNPYQREKAGASADRGRRERMAGGEGEGRGWVTPRNRMAKSKASQKTNSGGGERGVIEKNL